MIRERERQVMNGAVVLAAGVAGLFATVAWFIYAIQTRQPNLFGIVLLLLTSIVALAGLFIVAPNEARCCSCSAATWAPCGGPGSRWANPFYTKHRSRSASATSRRPSSRSTTSTATRSRSRRSWSGGSWTRPRRCSRWTTTSTTCRCRASRRCATWRRSYPYDAHDDQESRCAARPTRSPSS